MGDAYIDVGRKEANKIRVNLNYFKPTGKWYADASYETDKSRLADIWSEVIHFVDIGRLPGLNEGCKDLFVLIDVPDHEINHPKVVFPPNFRIIVDGREA